MKYTRLMRRVFSNLQDDKEFQAQFLASLEDAEESGEAKLKDSESNLTIVKQESDDQQGCTCGDPNCPECGGKKYLVTDAETGEVTEAIVTEDEVKLCSVDSELSIKEQKKAPRKFSEGKPSKLDASKLVQLFSKLLSDSDLLINDKSEVAEVTPGPDPEAEFPEPEDESLTFSEALDKAEEDLKVGEQALVLDEDGNQAVIVESCGRKKFSYTRVDFKARTFTEIEDPLADASEQLSAAEAKVEDAVKAVDEAVAEVEADSKAKVDAEEAKVDEVEAEAEEKKDEILNLVQAVEEAKGKLADGEQIILTDEGNPDEAIVVESCGDKEFSFYRVNYKTHSFSEIDELELTQGGEGLVPEGDPDAEAEEELKKLQGDASEVETEQIEQVFSNAQTTVFSKSVARNFSNPFLTSEF